MPVWAVTGGSGFLGGHLLARLGAEARPGVEVVAIGRACPAGWPSAAFERADLLDREALGRALDRIRPDAAFHLAGRTPPATDAELHEGNVLATTRLLDGLRELGRPCRVVLAGSAAELGPVPAEALPVGEDHPCRPVGAYGRGKLAATRAALAAQPPLEVVVARIFNPIGPGAPANQALGRFATELARGEGPVRLEVAGLDERRDFVDARDVADALIALARSGRGGRVYHVGTGRSRAVGEGLDRLIALSGREVEVDVRPGDPGSRGPSDSRADVGRIAAETGWAARIAWDDSLGDLWAAASGGSGSG